MIDKEIEETLVEIFKRVKEAPPREPKYYIYGKESWKQFNKALEEYAKSKIKKD